MENMRLTNKIIGFIFAFLILSLSSQNAFADFADADVTDINGAAYSALTDDNINTVKWLNYGDTVKVKSDDEITGIYLKWQTYPKDGIKISGSSEEISHNSGYFQDYIDLSEKSGTEFSIVVQNDCILMDVYAVTGTEIPETVHVWKEPHEKADILVLPTHGDDEHLFFGGVMPTYTERGDVKIQVAYMVDHSDNPIRRQELLNGLWVAGIRNYPVIPDFFDYASRSLEHAKTVYSETEILDYALGLIDEFQPQVIVGHDLNGEYGHGGHMLFADVLTQAVEQTGENPKKLYLHLYEENEIIMEVDTPLESFGGKTAFEVAVDAFAEHKSQVADFSVQASGPYDLRKFGLYYSTVGSDTGNDMMENIVSYEELDRIEAEKIALAEAEAEAIKVAELEAQAEADKNTAEIAEINEFAEAEEAELLTIEEENSTRLYILIAVSILFVLMCIIQIVYRSKRK